MRITDIDVQGMPVRRDTDTPNYTHMSVTDPDTLMYLQTEDVCEGLTDRGN